jgi:hypothetical protein
VVFNTARPAGRDPRLSIEVPEPPKSTRCEHCGRDALTTTGFVYRDGDAYAIYHAVLHWRDGNPQVDLAVAVGSWDADDSLADASAYLAIWTDAAEIRFGFVDPAASAWSSARRFAHELTADAARRSPARSGFLSVAEVIVRADPSVAAHLA